MEAFKIVAMRLALIVMMLALGGQTVSSAAAPATTPARIYPIVDVSSGFLLGGTSQGKWVSTDVMSNTVAGGERYRVYGLKGYLGRGIGTGATSAGVPCEDMRVVNMEPSYEKGGGIAMGGTWAAMPRVPRSLPTNTPVYVKAVSDLLKQNEVVAPRVKIEQILQVDLEGDRTNEVLVSASYFSGSENNEPLPSSEPGDYSVVFMRKLVGGKVQTVMLAENIILHKLEFSAPYKWSISGVLDLSGDGVMEVVLHGRYYEGDWTSIYQIKGTQFEEVLSAFCGA